ncbi:MAG: hypothetical protein Q8O67_19220 [Deltaproteobacteria bacterium]|nr:hypothetical protein [Deltaproteobacteria bacterium]
MSSLWHDPDFEPVRRFETPLVQKNFEDLPVPTEHHELPDGVKDPFARLDAVYDAAAVQMERGIKGAEFLHGKKPVADVVKPDDVARMQDRPTSIDPAKQTAQKLDKQEREQIRRVDQAAITQPTQQSKGTKTAGAREAEKAANAGAVDSAVSVAVTFGPMAAVQAATSLVQGPLPALAAQAASAVQTATAVAAAGQLGMVGIAEGLKETKEAPDLEQSSSSTPRRGLSKK